MKRGQQPIFMHQTSKSLIAMFVYNTVLTAFYFESPHLAELICCSSPVVGLNAGAR